VLSKIGAELTLSPDTTSEAILKTAASADALLVTYAKITAEMIAQMPRCRIVSRFGIGVDNVDIPAATSAGIVVTKVPDYCIDEVSDHTMALLLALVRARGVRQNPAARGPQGAVVRDEGRRVRSIRPSGRFHAGRSRERQLRRPLEDGRLCLHSQPAASGDTEPV
jgi:lactate dehydrogenase-like 2-hydroxyacid dehydrogenase